MWEFLTFSSCLVWRRGECRHIYHILSQVSFTSGFILELKLGLALPGGQLAQTIQRSIWEHRARSIQIYYLMEEGQIYRYSVCVLNNHNSLEYLISPYYYITNVPWTCNWSIFIKYLKSPRLCRCTEISDKTLKSQVLIIKCKTYANLCLPHTLVYFIIYL